MRIRATTWKGRWPGSNSRLRPFRSSAVRAVGPCPPAKPRRRPTGLEGPPHQRPSGNGLPHSRNWMWISSSRSGRGARRCRWGWPTGRRHRRSPATPSSTRWRERTRRDFRSSSPVCSRVSPGAGFRCRVIPSRASGTGSRQPAERRLLRHRNRAADFRAARGGVAVDGIGNLPAGLASTVPGDSTSSPDAPTGRMTPTAARNSPGIRTTRPRIPPVSQPAESALSRGRSRTRRLRRD